jgi:excisionase family DNA binding protein
MSGRTQRGEAAPVASLVPSPREPPRLRVRAYTVEEVAGLLHVGRDKIYYLLRTGQLRSIKIGKSRWITEEHLVAFVASLEDHPSGGSYPK